MAKYSIKSNFIGCIIATFPPTYERRDKGKFFLDENLSQKDLGYLYEVVKHEAIIKNDKKEPDIIKENQDQDSDK